MPRVHPSRVHRPNISCTRPCPSVTLVETARFGAGFRRESFSLGSRGGGTETQMRIETVYLRLLPYSPGHLLALIEGEERFEEGFGLSAALPKMSGQMQGFALYSSFR
jgi:hypothetical protein